MQPAHLPHDTLAFMFETYYQPRLTPHALGASNIGAGARRLGQDGGCMAVKAVPTASAVLPPSAPPDRDYYQCWIGLKSHFDPNRKQLLGAQQQNGGSGRGGRPAASEQAAAALEAAAP